MKTIGLKNKWIRIGFVIGSISIAVWCTKIAFGLREELTKKEQVLRIISVKESIRFLTEKHEVAFWLFTFEPCIVQIYGQRLLRSADLVSLEYYDEESLRNIIERENAYAILTDDQETDEFSKRYKFQTGWIRSHETTEVVTGMGWRLVRLGRNRDR